MRHSLRPSLAFAAFALAVPPAVARQAGDERAIPLHLGAGAEHGLSVAALREHGRVLFESKWTVQDGLGRPFRKGTGAPLSDMTAPLLFPRNFNRISSPEAASCRGCHDDPRSGGGGEFLTNAFVLAERFDFATFDAADALLTGGTADESGAATTLATIGNARSTIALFGAGYVEMLARQMTLELQAIRNTLGAGQSATLVAKGISFGLLARDPQGEWDVSQVKGLVQASLASAGPDEPPSLVVAPFGHGGGTPSLRQFTLGAFFHHLGVEAEERVGDGVDADQDGVAVELTRGDVTAATLFQATLPVPGRVIPKDPDLRASIRRGEAAFVEVGCASCHVPCLPLDDGGWVFSEPSPFNDPGQLQLHDEYHAAFGSLTVDLNAKTLPRPRLKAKQGRVEVWCFSDLRVHEITDGPSDPNREPLDPHAAPGSPAFFAGNGRFVTPRLWGVASTSPYFHHGKFTTLREAILGHGGEAAGSRAAFAALTAVDQDAVIEFLKTLRVLPEGTKHLVTNPKGKKVKWDFEAWVCGQPVE